MRIGIDVRLWNETGVGRYTRNLIENLFKIDNSNDYTLFARSVDYENIKNQISQIKKNWKLRPADVRWHTVDEQLKFPAILNHENLDLVHFPYFSVPIFYNKPFVVTIHDLILNHFPTGEASTLPLPIYKLKQLGYQFVINKAAIKAKKVITVSIATKDEIVDHLGIDESKVVVTYEGYSNQKSNIKNQISPFQKNKKIKLKEYFLYVGNAYPHKNLERLVEAFNQFYHEILRSDQDNIKLVLVGKEDYFYKRLKERIKSMNMQESVLLYGQVTDEELGYLYKNAKALILPSIMEGFGLPVLEAMAEKCLVVCSDIPSFREICKDTAIYFNPKDIEDIKRVLRSVCSDKLNYDIKKRIDEGFERSKNFSWEKMAEETLKIYESSTSIR